MNSWFVSLVSKKAQQAQKKADGVDEKRTLALPIK
jgi:hypothetical protein